MVSFRGLCCIRDTCFKVPTNRSHPISRQSQSCNTHTHTQTRTDTLAHTHTHTLSLSLSLTHTHTHTRTIWGILRHIGSSNWSKLSSDLLVAIHWVPRFRPLNSDLVSHLPYVTWLVARHSLGTEFSSLKQLLDKVTSHIWLVGRHSLGIRWLRLVSSLTL